MTTDSPEARRFRRVAEAFERLRPLPAAEREARLLESCGGDAQLAAEVRELMRFHEEPATRLDRSVMQRPDGAMIGRYRIERLIGEGGMGTVYLASQQEPVHRQVALKVVKLGMDTRRIVRHFEAERQVLARMEHPSVAHVLDGGVTADGRPFFVMELVDGPPVTDYCDARRLGVRARLEVFLQVCGAVQHAHQKGVLHRDIKPGNVLVAEVDGRPLPKVIDFGVAKALDEGVHGAGTSATSAGAVVGTPDYMSPEQAEIGADVDIRSDVYSLGVLLYELLAGETPLQSRATGSRSRGGSIDELRRRVREEPPLRPSSTVDAHRGQPAARDVNAVAERRATDPRTLRRLLSGDLDWIVLKALAKEPGLRYPTVSALAEDLERFLHQQPVQARPPAWSYVGLRFAQRHTAAFAGAAATVLALVVGLTLALAAMREARIERNDARAAKEREEGVAKALKVQLFAAAVEWGRGAGREGKLEQARTALWGAWRDDPTSPHAAWALRELYLRFPCLMTKRLDGHVWAAALVDDDTGVLVCDDIGGPRVIDATTGALRRVFSGPAVGAVDVDVSPDGALAVTASESGRVDLWDVAHGAWKATVAEHGAGSTAAVFARDGAAVFTGGADGRILRFPLVDGAAAVLIDRSAERVRRLVAASDGAVAAGMISGVLRVFRANERREMPGHSGTVLAVAFSADGRRLASGGVDREVHVSDVETGELLETHSPYLGTIRDLRYVERDAALLVLTWTELSRIDLATGAITTDLPEPGWRLSLAADEATVVLTSPPTGSVRTWRRRSAPSRQVPAPWLARLPVADGALLVSRRDAVALLRRDGSIAWEAPMPSPTGLAWSGRAGRVACGGRDGTVRVLSVADGAMVAEGRCAETQAARHLAFDGAGDRVAFACGASVMLFEIAGGSVTEVMSGLPNQILGVAISAGGESVSATARRVGVFTARANEGEARLMPVRETIFPLAVFDDGARVVAGGWHGELVFIDLVSSSYSVHREHAVLVNRIIPDPVHPEILLSFSNDGGIDVWHRGLERCVLFAQPFGARQPVRTAGFTDDGDGIVAVSMTGEIARWSLAEIDARVEANRDAELARLSAPPVRLDTEE